VETWLVPWDPCGRREGVAGPLDSLWPPLRRGRSPGLRVATVWAWPVPLAPCAYRGGVAGLLGPVWPP